MKTVLYDNHIKLGAKMAPFGGWDMPIQYEGILKEHEYTRSQCSIFDICHMGEFLLSGSTAGADLERLLTQSIANLKMGQCRYGYLLSDDGGVIDDLTCYRKGDDTFMLVVNAATCSEDAEWIQSHLSPSTMFRDISSQTGKLDIQGPTARQEMERILGQSLPDLKYFYYEDIISDGIHCMLSRTGYTGEWGYELYVPIEETVGLWERFIRDGRIKPAGLGARDTLRLEVGYPLYGHELSRSQTPVSASHGSFIDMSKDFVGKKAVAADLEQGCERVLVGLKLETKRAARSHDKVFSDERDVGEVTSGSLGPSVGVAIAMAYVEKSVSDVGTSLNVDVRGKRLNAIVVDMPFYKDGTARKKQSGQ